MTPSAMIFAAGFGTRMKDLTQYVPKPMLPISGRPMIDYTVDILRAAGISRLVANTHYLADVITPHLEALEVSICHEDRILETGGGLRAALPVLGSDPVITMNPDVVWKGPNPVTVLLENWREDMSALLMLVPSPKEGNDDDFDLSKGELTRKGPFRYTGLQILRADRLDEIEEEAFSLNKYWDLIAKAGSLHGCIYPGEWRDAGTPFGLMDAERFLSP